MRVGVLFARQYAWILTAASAHLADDRILAGLAVPAGLSPAGQWET